jgi:hypothetical protein
MKSAILRGVSLLGVVLDRILRGPDLREVRLDGADLAVCIALGAVAEAAPQTDQPITSFREA